MKPIFLAATIFIAPQIHAAPVAQNAPAAQKAVAPQLSLAQWARTQNARQAYGLYLNERKIGYMTMSFQVIAQPDGAGTKRDVAISSLESVFRLRSADPKSAPDMKINTQSVFALSGDGRLIGSQMRQVENGRPTTYRLIFGAQTQLETESGGKKVRRVIEHPQENLVESRKMMQWLQSVPKKGAQFSYHTTSLDDETPNSSETLTFRERKTIAWGGIKTPVYSVQMQSQGVSIEADLRANGMFVSGRVAGLIELRAEEESVARDLSNAGVDLLTASLIPVDKKLGDPRLLKSLTLQADGVTDLSIPQSKRQQLVRREGKLVLQMRADFSGNDVQVLAADEKRQFLAATTAIQSDEVSIRALAKKIAGTETDPVAKATKLTRWVYTNLGKSMDANGSTALQVLATRKGDCTEHALLFTTLARAAGLPAREVTGLAYVETPDPVFGWHAWSEIYDGRQWVTMDPTWNQVRVDASHIKFADRNDDYRWTSALGKLKLKVLAVEAR